MRFRFLHVTTLRVMFIRGCAVLALVAALVPCRPALAQDLGENARITGMANSGAALMHGIDAIGVNPAQIAPENGMRASFTILPLGFQAGTDFINWGTYKKYFTGRVDATGRRVGYPLTEADKQSILNEFDEANGNFSVNGRYTLMAAAFRINTLSFALSVSEKIGANGAIPRQFVEFLFNGNPPGRRFDLQGLDVNSSWTRDYGVSFATTFRAARNEPALSVGATVKYVQGFGWFAIDRFKSWFYTDPDSFVITGRADMSARSAGSNWIEGGQFFIVTPFPRPVGSGFGLDAGAQLAFGKSFSASFAVTDLGMITWDGDTRQYLAATDFTISDVSSTDQLDDLKRKLDGFSAPTGAFTTALPTALMLGVAAEFQDAFGRNRPLALALAAREGVNDVPGNSTRPRVGIGAEASFLPFLPVRAGCAFGGIQRVTFALGLGLRLPAVAVDVATGNILSLIDDGFSSASFSLGWRVNL